MLVDAAGRGEFDRLRELLDQGVSPNAAYRDGYSALMAASQAGFHKTARLLLEHGADPNLSDAIGRTPLTYAVRTGNVELTQLLLESGADVTNRIDSSAYVFPGFGILHFAISGGSVDIVEMLANRNVEIDTQDTFGETPLMKAVEAGNFAIARFLLDHGANKEIVNIEGRTAVKLARQKGRRKMERLLIGTTTHPD